MNNTGIYPPRLQPAGQRDLCELLPWFVAGSLSSEEHAAVATHLLICARCQHDVARQRMVQAAGAQEQTGTTWERSLARLRRSAEIPAPPKLSPRLLHAHMRNRPGLVAAIVLSQFVVIFGLILLLTLPLHSMETTVIEAHNGNIPNVLVIFRPQTTIQDLQRILSASQTQVIEGPMATGAYLLAVSEGQRNQAIIWLRLQSAVLFAQSLNNS